jgi:pimeloyl-ACP methyl ester carboxylesterase
MPSERAAAQVGTRNRRAQWQYPGVPSTTRALFSSAILLTLVLSACSVPGKDAQSAPVTETRGPAGAVPAGLGRFYGQPLSWGPCGSYARSEQAKSSFGDGQLQCARMTVPLDYAKPDGQKISLGVLRRKASVQDKRIGSLVINPGGPGVSGMEAAAGLAGKVGGNELGKRFDLVGFDPRGIGASEPTVRCYTDRERDTVRAEDLDVDSSPAGVAKAEAEQKSYAAKCAKRTKDGDAMLAHLGTREVVKDMDVLRSALGDKKLTYLGFSYGTRIGSAYAEAFPRNVRAMVLDGAVDPDENATDSVVAQGKGFQTAFTQFADWCVRQQQCALGKDKTKAVAKYRALVNPLIDKPVKLDDGRLLSYDDASTAAIQALYSQQYWSILNKGLTGLASGDGRMLMALADAYFERSPDGKYTTTQDANTAVRCVDDPHVTDRAKLKAAEEKYQREAPFLDDGKPPVGELDACAFWPVPNTSKPHLPKVSGLPPTLTISTTNDPATPYQAGVNLAKALGGGLLTFEGTQHTAFLQDNKCVDAAGVRYLVDLRLPAPGTRCS